MEDKPDIIQSFIKLDCKCSNNGYHLYDIQKWLREVKRTHIHIAALGENLWSFMFEKLDEDGTTLNGGHLGRINYNTYEKALEAGIWEAYYLLNN